MLLVYKLAGWKGSDSFCCVSLGLSSITQSTDVIHFNAYDAKYNMDTRCTIKKACVYRCSTQGRQQEGAEFECDQPAGLTRFK
jgi:hypothetical protein